jgi:hypothetical protein
MFYLARWSGWLNMPYGPISCFANWINRITQPSLDVSPIWIPHYSNLRVRSLWSDRFRMSICSYIFLVPGFNFCSINGTSGRIHFYNVKIFKLFLCIDLLVFGLLHLFSTYFSILVSDLYMHYHTFYLHFPVTTRWQTLTSGIYIAVTIMT